jgi:hypothetical protein
LTRPSAVDPSGLFARASAAGFEGRQTEAAQLLDSLVAEQPRNITALNTLVMIPHTRIPPYTGSNNVPLLSEAERAAVRVVG